MEQGKRSTVQNTFRPTIDVYALGGTLFKMLTGNTPPTASDILEDDELLQQILEKHNISNKLQNIIISAMKPTVKKRTQFMQEIIDQLSDIDETTPNINNKPEADIEIIANIVLDEKEDTPSASLKHQLTKKKPFSMKIQVYTINYQKKNILI